MKKSKQLQKLYLLKIGYKGWGIEYYAHYSPKDGWNATYYQWNAYHFSSKKEAHEFMVLLNKDYNYHPYRIVSINKKVKKYFL
jgi:hypothetical protein